MRSVRMFVASAFLLGCTESHSVPVDEPLDSSTSIPSISDGGRDVIEAEPPPKEPPPKDVWHQEGPADATNVSFKDDGTFVWTSDGCDVSAGRCGRWKPGDDGELAIDGSSWPKSWLDSN